MAGILLWHGRTRRYDEAELGYPPTVARPLSGPTGLGTSAARIAALLGTARPAHESAVSAVTASEAGNSRLSLGTPAARNLATTTKSLPQTQEISARHPPRVLPWVRVTGATYRLNRRLIYRSDAGSVTAANPRARQNKYGEAEIELVAGHVGEVTLPGTFVDYDLTPREHELSVAQTILRIHTRVADLYNEPMNQTEQQLRLTIEALRDGRSTSWSTTASSACCTMPIRGSASAHGLARPPPTTSMNSSAAGENRTAFWHTPEPSPPSGGSATAEASIRSSSTPGDPGSPPGEGCRSCRATRSRSAARASARSSSCGSARPTKVSSACTARASRTSTSPVFRFASRASTRRRSPPTS